MKNFNIIFHFYPLCHSLFVSLLLLTGCSKISQEALLSETKIHVTDDTDVSDVSTVISQQDIIDFFNTISNGNVDKVVELLEEGIDPAIRDLEHFPALHCAITNNQVEITIELLKWLKDINMERDDYCDPPLFYAADIGNKEIVELLLDAGASVDVRNKNESTPLYAAIEGGYQSIVAFLLQQGANPNVEDNEGLTPLFYAIDKAQEAIAILLLKQGANPNAKDNEGGRLLSMAIFKGQMGIVRALVKYGAIVNENDKKYKQYPLCRALAYRECHIARFLLKQGANPNVKDLMEEYPLHRAVEENQLGIVKLLLQCGAQKDVQDSYKKTPLDYAKERGKKAIIKLLSSQQPNTVTKRIKKPNKLCVASNVIKKRKKRLAMNLICKQPL